MNSKQELRREYKQYILHVKIVLKSKNEQCTMDILLPMEKRRNFQLLPIIIITLTNQIVWMLVLLTDILLI